FFGVVVYTRVHTPRRCGLPLSAGVLVLLVFACRPLRTSCWIVGIPASSLPVLSLPSAVTPGRPRPCLSCSRLLYRFASPRSSALPRPPRSGVSPNHYPARWRFAPAAGLFTQLGKPSPGVCARCTRPTSRTRPTPDDTPDVGTRTCGL